MKKLFSILFLALFYAVAYSQAPALPTNYSAADDPSALGKMFPEISLTTLDGKTINNKTFENKIVIISHGFKSCPPCRAKMKGLNILYNKYKNNSNIVFFYVSTDDVETARKFTSGYNAEYPVVSVSWNKRSSFSRSGSPTTIIVNKKGKVIYKDSGGSANEEKATRELLEKVAPVIDKELTI